MNHNTRKVPTAFSSFLRLSARCSMLIGRVFQNFPARLVLLGFVVLLAGNFAGPVNGQTADVALKGSLASSISDGVDVFSGKLEQVLPLTTVHGRGELSQGLYLPFRNAEWRVTETGSSQNNGKSYHYFSANQTIDPRNMRAGYLTLGKLEAETKFTGWYYLQVPSVTELTYTSNSGTIIKLRDTLTNGQPYDAGNRGCIFSAFQVPNPLPATCSRGNVFRAIDGSNVIFVADSDIYDLITYDMYGSPSAGSLLNNLAGTLFMSDGTRIRIEGNIRKITDRNGNFMTAEYYTENNYNFNFLKKLTDSMNREVSIVYGDASQANYYDEIVYKGFGETERRIRINYGGIGGLMVAGESLGVPLFPEVQATCQYITTGEWCDPTSAGGNSLHYATSVTVPSSIVLPNGQQYQFYYNRYLELARIKYPTGSYIDYSYGGMIGSADDGVNGGSIYRRVTSVRTFDATAQLINEKTFSNIPQFTPAPNSTLVDNVTIDVKDANGSVLSESRHYFNGSADMLILYPFLPAFWAKEYKSENLDPVSHTVLQRTEKTWAQRDTFQWCTGYYTFPSLYSCDSASPMSGPPVDTRIVEVKTTLETGQLTKKTFAYDQYNNVTDTYEYDYDNGQPGPFLRRSHTDYVTDNNYTSVSGPYLIRLPLHSWASSDINGDNKSSFVQYEYDNYTTDLTHAALVPRSNVTGFDASYSPAYTRRGNQTSVTGFIQALDQTGPVTSNSQFDVLGNVVKTIDAKGFASTADYSDHFGSPNGEARGNWDTVYMPAQLGGHSTFAFATSTTKFGNFTTYTQFDYSTGLAVDAEDINGTVNTCFFNDPLDRLTQMITANNRSDQRSQKTFSFDDFNRINTTTSDLYTFGDNLSKSESLYNSLGQTIETRNYEAGGYIVSKPEYDALGRVVKTSNPYRPYLSEALLWTTTEYDALGRTAKVKAPDNSETLTAYVGNATTITDPTGKQRRSLVNAIGQLTRMDEPNPQGDIGTPENPTQPTAFFYNTNGQMVKVIQGAQIRYFLYDSLGRLKRVRQPEQDVNPSLALSDPITSNSQWSTASTYDANGNTLTTTDAKGVVVTQTYDELGRVLTRSYSNSTPTVTHVYDDPNIPFSKGQITKVSSSISMTEYTSFDSVGRVLAHKQTTDGHSYTTAYVYNLSGALIEETYPSGRIVRNAFNNNAKLIDVSSKAGGQESFQSYANNFSYTAVGAVQQMHFGNGNWESIQFNSRLQPIQIALGTTQNATNLWQTNYDYGELDAGGNLHSEKNNGNIARQTINFGGLSQPFVQTFRYDPLNRLSEATEAAGGTQTWSQSLQYDRYGNRLTFNQQKLGDQPITQTPTVDPASNRFTTGQGFTYDPNGNVIQDVQSRQFIFDGDNKQIEVRDAGNNVVGTYYYDGGGRRVKKITASETTVFVYSAGDKLLAEYSTQATANPGVSYVTTDNLGSPRAITDSLGNLRSRRDFMPFGEELVAGTANRNGTDKYGYGSDNLRQRFTGYEKDVETGLDFAEARYYDNRYGRFTAIDPMLASGSSADVQSFNRYAYVMNNPLTVSDPTGMSADQGWVTANFGPALFDDDPSVRFPIPFIEYLKPKPPQTPPAGQSSATPPAGQTQSSGGTPPAQSQPQTAQERNRQNFANHMAQQFDRQMAMTLPLIYGLGLPDLTSAGWHCNCAAAGFGIDDRWIQAGWTGVIGPVVSKVKDRITGVVPDGGQQVLTRANYYWNELPIYYGGIRLREGQTCSAGRYQLRTFQDSTYLNEPFPVDSKGRFVMGVLHHGNVHIMYQSAPGSIFWSSKNGGGYAFHGITNPNAFYNFHYNPIGAVSTTDYCMPVKRP